MVASLKDIPHHYYSLEEYFALEKVGEARYEFWDGDIVCMSGGSPQHAIISSNIHRILSNKLTGEKCQSFTSDMAIYTPKYPPYRYPDASIVCSEATYKKFNGNYALENPLLLVEVLSATTEHADKNQKRLAYQAIKSLQEYILIAQDEAHVTQYVCEGDFWRIKDYRAMEATNALPSLKVEITLAEIYRGVTFE